VPDLGAIDFTNLTLIQLISSLLFFAALDTGVAVVLAVMRNEFSVAYLLDFLRTHILKVGVPIVGLGIVGNGISVGGEVFVPAVPAAGIAASVSLAGYVVVTIASIRESFNETKPVPQTLGGVTPEVLTPLVETADSQAVIKP
jgi:hypothetical protein